MISVDEAVHLLTLHMPSWGTTVSSVEALASDVLSEPLIADRDYPPFHRAMMDGIAVSFEAYESGQRIFEIEGIAPAGEPRKKLSRQTSCFEVMTGAPLPEGATLIIPYEELTLSPGKAEITVEEERELMEYVHEKGSDCRKGDVLLSTGAVLNGPHWGIAASLGYASPKVEKKPRVNLISTGDELVAVDETPEDHQIRRSNVHALKASLENYGIKEIVLSHLSDNEDAISKHFQAASKEFDLLIYSGGVSKGKFDYLPAVWKKSGVTECFHGVRQKPGKPLWFGVHSGTNTAIVGLPGNPVSSLVCLHRYILRSPKKFVRLKKDLVVSGKLTSFIPVRIEQVKDAVTYATPVLTQNSGEFAALAETDGFIEAPMGRASFKDGENLRYFSWGPSAC